MCCARPKYNSSVKRIGTHRLRRRQRRLNYGSARQQQLRHIHCTVTILSSTTRLQSWRRYELYRRLLFALMGSVEIRSEGIGRPSVVNMNHGSKSGFFDMFLPIVTAPIARPWPPLSVAVSIGHCGVSKGFGGVGYCALSEVMDTAESRYLLAFGGRVSTTIRGTACVSQIEAKEELAAVGTVRGQLPERVGTGGGFLAYHFFQIELSVEYGPSKPHDGQALRAGNCPGMKPSSPMYIDISKRCPGRTICSH